MPRHNSLLPPILINLLSLLLLTNIFNFSISQSTDVSCNPCLDRTCPDGLSCDSNNCCVNSSSSSTTTTSASPSSSCQDSAPSNLCNVYKQRGQCLQPFLIVWLSIHCKSTCGLCSARIVRIG
uniref:ShKT domain-containing protein n=1 Tax=Globodera rostochiensis TaxID=31243 RepID=A0A914HX87_GLORO